VIIIEFLVIIFWVEQVTIRMIRDFYFLFMIRRLVKYFVHLLLVQFFFFSLFFGLVFIIVM